MRQRRNRTRQYFVDIADLYADYVLDYGFYQAFSESFKNSIITADVPNREWETGEHYYTRDRVFIPSITELGDTDHFYSYKIGTAYSYFYNENSIDLSARLSNDQSWIFWWETYGKATL